MTLNWVSDFVVIQLFITELGMIDYIINGMIH